MNLYILAVRGFQEKERHFGPLDTEILNLNQSDAGGDDLDDLDDEYMGCFGWGKTCFYNADLADDIYLGDFSCENMCFIPIGNYGNLYEFADTLDAIGEIKDQKLSFKMALEHSYVWKGEFLDFARDFLNENLHLIFSDNGSLDYLGSYREHFKTTYLNFLAAINFAKDGLISISENNLF
ncbi:hypothetical protein MOW14_14680 (plasmid) [Acinetobacter indicus]|uniref:hypothetical protein n=1 Tax=Acinetobacter indicus TaxID=756892 RepID=UPI001FA76C4E|nr:hypothetical protein [Acinetobacter indicus]UNW11146.1 hypothetical protein MOW14_14680 [Acinetobacter indicus]